MPHIATQGTSSCATMSIGGYKTGGNQRELNEQYKANPKSFTYPTIPNGQYDVKGWSNSVLLPTSQPLGRTFDIPFEKLMEDIENSGLKDKLITTVLNQSQYDSNDKYWHRELLRWGFKLHMKTKNSWGSMNYLYIRAPLESPILEGEAD